MLRFKHKKTGKNILAGQLFKQVSIQ